MCAHHCAKQRRSRLHLNFSWNVCAVYLTLGASSKKRKESKRRLYLIGTRDTTEDRLSLSRQPWTSSRVTCLVKCTPLTVVTRQHPGKESQAAWKFYASGRRKQTSDSAIFIVCRAQLLSLSFLCPLMSFGYRLCLPASYC